MVIDEWPWIDPYIEIEGPSGQAVKSATEQLGFSWSDAVFGHIDAVYERAYTFQNGIRGVIDLQEVRFDDPVPAEFGEREV